MPLFLKIENRKTVNIVKKCATPKCAAMDSIFGTDAYNVNWNKAKSDLAKFGEN
jgi:hypothetical protein